MSESEKPHPSLQPGLFKGLSGKVLLLTILFVMLGEVLIFLPSIANFRVTWLKNRIAQAEIAALAVEAAPARMLSPDLRTELLKGAGVLVVSIKKGEVRQLVLRGDRDHMVDRSFDLRVMRWPEAVGDAFDAMLTVKPRVISVVDIPPNMTGDFIEVALDETPLRKAMLQYGLNILALSIVLSFIVAGLVFLALNRVLVRPMRRLSANMLAFTENPEDGSRVIVPSKRRDEIGIAERELHEMQTELASMLQQKSRLAALGLAVSKVSHDLRNMLSSAHLISDRLGMVNDPTVKKFTPKLIASLDRAIDFCLQTLKYGRAQEAPPRREKFPLHGLTDEVIDGAIIQAASSITLYNNVPLSLAADADRDQLFRVLTNLARNAIQAIEAADMPVAGAVTIAARREGSVTVIEVKDNGPGIPERVRAKLFEAFQSAARPGGTGLGLAIAAELVQAHGGSIALAASNETGSIFQIAIPDRIGELRTGRRGERMAGL